MLTSTRNLELLAAGWILVSNILQLLQLKALIHLLAFATPQWFVVNVLRYAIFIGQSIPIGMVNVPLR